MSSLRGVFPSFSRTTFLPVLRLHPSIYDISAHEPFEISKLTSTGKLQPPALKQLLAHMATQGSAAADPPKQTTTYLLYWRKPEEWGQLIYDWVSTAR